MLTSDDGDLQISVVIPARNEATRIGDVVRTARQFANEVIVVDDGSDDDTASVAEAAGARVVRQKNAGYIAAVKRGFRHADGEIVVTMDGDGEHRAEAIPGLVAPITEDRADLVLGRRRSIPRLSERLLNWLTRLRVPEAHDTGTGFRALRRELALELQLRGRCICGVSVLEPVALGARVAEVPVELARVHKPRSIAWFHVPQVWHVLGWLMRRRDSRRAEV